MHVLVCEDDPAARFVIKRWLSSTLGCTVTDCEDGVQALDLLSSRPFDLAVLDLDSTSGELSNMVNGRIDAWLKAQSLTSSFTLPAPRNLPDSETLPPIEPGAGFVRAFTVEGHTTPLLLRLAVRRPD